MEVSNESFWKQLKEVISECFTSPKIEEKVEEPIEEKLEEEKPTETPQEAPKAEEPTPVKEEVKEAPVEPKNEPTEEVKVEEPKEEPKDNHLEELIGNLKDEIAALKEMNQGLQAKIKDLGKQPSAKPVNVLGGNNNSNDTYSAWRDQMAKYLA